MLDFGKQHDEFIAALPADRVRGAHAIHQPLGDGLKKLVADRMSQRIVDVLETVQIQKQHRDLFRMTLRQGDRLADSVVQEHPIGQPGQKIVLGRMRHLQRHRAGGAHIAKNDYRPSGLPFAIVNRGDGVFDRNFDPIPPDQNAVRRQLDDRIPGIGE